MSNKRTQEERQIKHFFRHNNALNRGHATKIVRTFDQISEADKELEKYEDDEHLANSKDSFVCGIEKYKGLIDRVFFLLYMGCLLLGTKELFVIQDHKAGYITLFSGILVILGVYFIRSKYKVCPSCKHNKKTK